MTFGEEGAVATAQCRMSAGGRLLHVHAADHQIFVAGRRRYEADSTHQAVPVCGLLVGRVEHELSVDANGQRLGALLDLDVQLFDDLQIVLVEFD